MARRVIIAKTKSLLQCYRAGGQDEGDPVFVAALKNVASDPALAAWFREEQEFDAAITRKFSAVPVDLAVKERILRGASQPPPGKERSVPPA